MWEGDLAKSRRDLPMGDGRSLEAGVRDAGADHGSESVESGLVALASIFIGKRTSG